MKLFAPEYYKAFRCIADKCTHSCCIGWEIDVDEDTLELYKSAENSYAQEILNSIDVQDTPHFVLKEGERCPHLDKNGLCKIITNCGEGYLCDICREHPRFYNNTALGKEVGIGMACEEAARIILSSDSFDNFLVIDELNGDAEPPEFDALPLRSHLFSLIKSSNGRGELLEKISQGYGVTLDSTERYKELFENIEYLDGGHKELFCSFNSQPKPPKSAEDKLKRALAYFIYRHCTDVYSQEEFLSSLGFALVCEALLASLVCQNENFEIEHFAVVVSEEIEYSTDNTEAIKELFV